VCVHVHVDVCECLRHRCFCFFFLTSFPLQRSSLLVYDPPLVTASDSASSCVPTDPEAVAAASSGHVPSTTPVRVQSQFPPLQGASIVRHAAASGAVGFLQVASDEDSSPRSNSPLASHLSDSDPGLSDDVDYNTARWSELLQTLRAAAHANTLTQADTLELLQVRFGRKIMKHVRLSRSVWYASGLLAWCCVDLFIFALAHVIGCSICFFPFVFHSHM
jgi:hypothetical protein